MFMLGAGVNCGLHPGSQGRLGHGTENDVAVPTLVESLLNHETVDVQCGHRHTIARKS